MHVSIQNGPISVSQGCSKTGYYHAQTLIEESKKKSHHRQSHIFWTWHDFPSHLNKARCTTLNRYALTRKKPQSSTTFYSHVATNMQPFMQPAVARTDPNLGFPAFSFCLVSVDVADLQDAFFLLSAILPPSWHGNTIESPFSDILWVRNMLFTVSIFNTLYVYLF